MESKTQEIVGVNLGSMFFERVPDAPRTGKSIQYAAQFERRQVPNDKRQQRLLAAHVLCIRKSAARRNESQWEFQLGSYGLLCGACAHAASILVAMAEVAINNS